MRLLRLLVTILMIISLTFAVFLRSIDLSSRGGPDIICDEKETIYASCDVTNEELLSHVTAKDQQDGDITDRVVVERGTYFLEKGVSTITYSVCDNDNKVTKLSRNIVYSDYKSPEIHLNGDLIASKNSNYDFSKYFTAEDILDGNINNRLKIISDDYNRLVANKYDVLCKANNSFGDTVEMTLNVWVTDYDLSAATINLSDYLIYVPLNSNIDFRQYLKGVINEQGNSYSTSSVTIDSSEYNPEEEGTYEVYFTIYRGKDVVALTRMFVIVKGD